MRPASRASVALLMSVLLTVPMKLKRLVAMPCERLCGADWIPVFQADTESLACGRPWPKSSRLSAAIPPRAGARRPALRRAKPGNAAAGPEESFGPCSSVLNSKRPTVTLR